MSMQASSIWKRLRRSLTADPGRFAGGSAVSGPLGLLAVEQEHAAALQWSQRDAHHPAAGRFLTEPDSGSPPDGRTGNQGTGQGIHGRDQVVPGPTVDVKDNPLVA